MKTSSAELGKVLTELITANVDRASAYRYVTESSSNLYSDLTGIFHRMSEKSIQFADDLRKELQQLPPIPNDAAIGNGNSSTALKNGFDLNDRGGVLAGYEKREENIQRVYGRALDNASVNSAPLLRELLAAQKMSLKIAYETIRKYRQPEYVR
ncbi:MAG: hypothetical protein H7Y31_08790 [Chitinophagaceae bacterium]|nr:hypothetical protein [Chitinophagaceae bacterium]